MSGYLAISGERRPEIMAPKPPSILIYIIIIFNLLGASLICLFFFFAGVLLRVQVLYTIRWAWALKKFHQVCQADSRAWFPGFRSLAMAAIPSIPL